MLPIVLAGCGSMDRANPDGDLPHDGDAPTGPALELTSPPRAGYVAAGPTRVGGVARRMSDVALDGTPLTPSGGLFSTDDTLAVGLNTFEVTAVGPDGEARSDLASALAGEFVAPTGLVRDALRVHVSAAGLAAAGPLVAGLLDPATLDASIQALNPLVDDANGRVELGTLSYATPIVELVPVDGAIELTIRLVDFVLPVDATVYDALPFGIDLDLGVDLQADEVVLAARVEVRADGQGGLAVDVGALDAELGGFDLDTGILELVDWLFVDDDDLADQIEAELAGLGPTLDAMVQELVAGLDLSLETELLERTVSVGPSFDAVAIDPSGLALSVGVAIDVAGAPDDGKVLFLGAPPPSTGGEVHLQVADDLLERGLYELWAAGALDLEIPLVDEAAIVLALFGGRDEGTLALESALPPVWVERDGLARLQMGEVALTVETPGGDYGDRIEMTIALDARADLSITADAVGIVLSDAKVAMRLTGGSAGDPVLEEQLPMIEGAFGLGIGLMNDLLSVPLAEVLPEGTALPAIALLRDPSRKGSVVDLAVADLAAIVVPTTTTPSGSVSVPGTAAVLDDDQTVTTAGTVGWVCEDDEVVVEADGGTWYVSGDAALVVRGTGHVVYAADDAEVVLEASGNTVYADPGADVDDDDGGNVVVVDPLALDLATAPSPGCG